MHWTIEEKGPADANYKIEWATLNTKINHASCKLITNTLKWGEYW